MKSDIISRILKILTVIRLLSNNKYSADNLSKASKNVLNFEDINLDNYQEIPVGKTIMSYIKSILLSHDNNTGIKELDDLPEEELNKYLTISKFIDLKGIGIVKALKYYDDGYRNIDELPNNIIKTKIKRNVIDIWLDIFENIIKEINFANDTDIFFTPCGSYSRGSKYSNDIDIILCSSKNGEVGKYINKIIYKCKKEEIILNTISFGKTKFEGMAKIPEEDNIFQIDIEIINNTDNYYYELLYFTGPASLNIKMRSRANKLGYHLTNSYMTDQNGNNITVKSEEEIFNILGFNYVDPINRF